MQGTYSEFQTMALHGTNRLWKYSDTHVLVKQIPHIVYDILFPTKTATLQPEVGFIYKSHNPKLILTGQPAAIPSLTWLSFPDNSPSQKSTEKLIWRSGWKVSWRNIGGCFLDGETEARRGPREQGF
jgi:hypothetical protein